MRWRRTNCSRDCQRTEPDLEVLDVGGHQVVL